MPTKSWYLSRTVWAAIVTILSAGLGLAGLPLSDADSSSLAEALLQIVTAAAGIAALVGRIRASHRIG